MTEQLTPAISEGEDEARLNRAARALFDDLVKYCANRRLDGSALARVQEIADRHRAVARYHGIDFPDLVVMVLPDHGAIELVRRDIEASGMAVILHNICQKYPQVTPRQLAESVARAFPGRRFDTGAAHDKAAIELAARMTKANG